MNHSDTEIAWSILKDVGYNRTTDVTKVCKCCQLDCNVFG